MVTAQVVDLSHMACNEDQIAFQHYFKNNADIFMNILLSTVTGRKLLMATNI